MRTYKLAHKTSPILSSDLHFTHVKEGFVKKAASSSASHIISEYTEISDQGNLSSCAANATIDSLEILIGLENPNNVVQLSRLFGYYNARAKENNTHKDEGIYITDAFECLKTLGVCTENDWPYVESNVFAQPSIMAYKSANPNKLHEHYRIVTSGQERLNDIETAIKANHPVVFGTDISNEFMNYYSSTEKVFSTPILNEILGAHAMIITGFRNNNGAKEYYIRNSWSKEWGINGHCWMDVEYMMSDRTSELWVPTRVPQLIF